MAGTIGIKIANGDFYPITGENTPVRKRLVLTTVHDRQGSVQIDLFRSISKSMMDAQYIGSLVVENIRHKPKGEPSIEMVISCDDSGNITAEAYDLDIASGGEHHILNVSLKTMDSAGLDGDFPDFDLESNAPQTPSGLYNYAESKKEERKKFPWLVMVLATLVVVIAIVVLWFFFLGGRDVLFPGRGRPPAIERPSVPAPQETPPPQETPAPRETPPPPEAPPPEAPPPEAQIEPAPPDPAEAVPVIAAPASPPPERPQAVQRKRPPAPVSSYKVPAVIPKNGVVYQIRWGDTLWDISEAFYRNPWLYPRIARFNNIRNPDFIIAGRNIRIPPRN